MSARSDLTVVIPTHDRRAILERCLATPGVHLVDVPIDYSEDGHALGEELREAAARA